MTNQTKIGSETTEQNIETNNSSEKLPLIISRYKTAFNSIALGILISTGVASTEAKAADTFDNLREATKYYNSMNNKLNKVTHRVEYLEEYADRNDERIGALELRLDSISRDNKSYKQNMEVDRNSNYSLKVDIQVGSHVFKTGANMQSSLIKGNLVRIDSITDTEGSKFTFDKDYWIERQYIDLNR